MKKLITCISAMALVATLPACGRSDEPADNAVVNADINEMMAEPDNSLAAEEVLMNEPAAQPATTTAAEPKAATPKPMPKPAPAKPKPAEPAPDSHAGHDMNNMNSM